ILSYQKSAGDLNYQLSAYGRSSRVHFEPDLLGDLFFNGEASDVARNLYSGGLQLDASYQLGDYHTVRGGFMFLDEYVADNSLTGVFPLGATGNPSGPAFNIPDNQVLHGIFAGAYLQDEWKILPQVTLNYGARFDEFYSSFDHENQISPRVNLIYQPTASTTLHAGYSRYFTPPPPEAVFSPNFTAYNGTSGSTGSTVNSPPKAERANYFDAGISQKLNRNLTLGLDGYYKSARNQLDDGLFGQSLVLDTFNYTQGLIYGVEATASYNQGGFSAYANLAYSIARGKNWSSSQFLFGADGPGTDLNYVRNNWIYLDHDQRVSGSFGVSYTWKQARGRTTVYCDALYGSGLRTDAAAADGSNIPNGGSLPHYWTVNMGVEQMFRWSGHDHLRARLDVENVSDNTYELRDGSGVGVNAAQFGQRAGFFGTLSYLF
ncbi:MAG TPA: TonB-dependent receptor, partial [Verrucomicrobiae bacterium]|nr:TonB-dependent receptor [Verrucomicrobiae bacterium]